MSEPSSPRRVVVCGHRSFAARGLAELLQGRGHEVTCFSRSAGVPVDQIHTSEQLPGPYDVVVNYIVLKDRSIEDNERYLESLLGFCKTRGVEHLIHLSSVSVYDGAVRRVTEDSRIESDPSRKGAYGSLKVAADQYLSKKTPPALKLSFVRPGFILGSGLVDPIVGMAFRAPGNRLLLLGSANNALPVVRRAQVGEAIARLVETPAGEPKPAAAYLLLDKNSPTRREWLEACCTRGGAGMKVTSFPAPLWRIAGFGGEIIARIARMSLRPNRMIRNVCRRQSFDPTETQKRLGMDFSFDWRDELAQSLEGQQPNFVPPYVRIPWQNLAARRITFLGFGGIVKQKHLPALRRLSFTGETLAYDLVAGRNPDGHDVRAIQGATLEPADLFVVASPPQAHIDALDLLRRIDGPVLIEKPLCYTADELDQWTAFAGSRAAGVFVCHNFRFKSNVAAMLEHVARFNPGKLKHVEVLFQSPPVSRDWRAWARDERRARTLLMDYAIHFLDVATMMSREEPWTIGDVRHELNPQGETSLIEGRVSGPAYSIGLLLRQGFIPRRARVLFTFQNYSISLGFFPDTFAAYMSHDGASLYADERKAARRATVRKVLDKLTGRDSDTSHAAAYLAAASSECHDSKLGSAIEVRSLRHFYRMLFDLGQRVYGT